MEFLGTYGTPTRVWCVRFVQLVCHSYLRMARIVLLALGHSNGFIELTKLLNTKLADS